MDNSPDSYAFTEQDQLHAAQILQRTTRYQISKKKPTYSSFPVRLDGHWAAVQIVITPSLHPQLARQTIFSLHYRYGFCCESISGDIADERIRQTVRNIVGAYFLFFEWDFTDEGCYTKDPASFLRDSCFSTIHSVLGRYNALAEPTAHTIEKPSRIDQETEETEFSGTKRRRLDSVAGPHRSKRGVEQDAINSSSSIDEQEEDKAIADKLTQKIRKGLRKVQKQALESNFKRDGLGELKFSGDDPYEYCVTKLMKLANELDKKAEMKQFGSWYARFLAGCITLASPSLPARPANLSSNGPLANRITIYRQESMAQITNMIVSGLWGGGWHKKACLVYHALAATNYKLTSTRKLGNDRLSGVAQMIINALEMEIPDFEIQDVLFDPSCILCGLLGLVSYRTICDALTLPPLQDINSNQISSHHSHSITALSKGLPGRHQSVLLQAIEPANGPPAQSPFTENGGAVVDAYAGSPAPEIQANASSPTQLSARYDSTAVETPLGEQTRDHLSSLEPHGGRDAELLISVEQYNEQVDHFHQDAVLPSFFRPYVGQTGGSQTVSLTTGHDPPLESNGRRELPVSTEQRGEQVDGPHPSAETLLLHRPYDGQASGFHAGSLPTEHDLPSESQEEELLFSVEQYGEQVDHSHQDAVLPSFFRPYVGQTGGSRAVSLTTGHDPPLESNGRRELPVSTEQRGEQLYSPHLSAETLLLPRPYDGQASGFHAGSLPIEHDLPSESQEELLFSVEQYGEQVDHSHQDAELPSFFRPYVGQTGGSQTVSLTTGHDPLLESNGRRELPVSTEQRGEQLYGPHLSAEPLLLPRPYDGQASGCHAGSLPTEHDLPSESQEEDLLVSVEQYGEQVDGAHPDATLPPPFRPYNGQASGPPAASLCTEHGLSLPSFEMYSDELLAEVQTSGF